MPTLQQIRDPEYLSTLVRELEFPAIGALKPWFPDDFVNGIEFMWTRFNGYRPPASTNRSWDTIVSPGQRPPVTRKAQELPPITELMTLTEEQSVRNFAINSGDWTPFIDAVIEDFTLMKEKIETLLELQRSALFNTGKVTITGPFKGFNGVTPVYEWTEEIDYGVPVGNKATASPLWSDTVNANPMTDALAWHRTYKSANKGASAGAILISDTVAGYIISNAAMRQLFYSGSSAIPISLDMVNAAMQSRGLPPFVVVDEQLVAADGTVKGAIDANKAIFVPPPSLGTGKTVFGRSAMANGLVANGTLKRIDPRGFVAWSQDFNMPPQRQSGIDGVGMPILGAAERIFIGTVAA